MYWHIIGKSLALARQGGGVRAGPVILSFICRALIGSIHVHREDTEKGCGVVVEVSHPMGEVLEEQRYPCMYMYVIAGWSVTCIYLASVPNVFVL